MSDSAEGGSPPIAPDRGRLRATFDEAALLYDRMRPTYPPALLDDLAELGSLAPGSKILEIGCGTGQLTVPLAARGYRVTAVELGAGLAGVARQRLAEYPDAEVVIADFDGWTAPESYDLVVAATSFHWLDPATRLARCRDALRPGGALAVISTEHVYGGTVPFFADAQDCYERWDPATPPGLRLESADAIPSGCTELDDSGLFAPAAGRRYEWDARYSTAEYLDVLRTYSGHRALPAVQRDGLLACIAGLIDSRYGGRITKRYLNELVVARRV